MFFMFGNGLLKVEVMMTIVLDDEMDKVYRSYSWRLMVVEEMEDLWRMRKKTKIVLEFDEKMNDWSNLTIDDKWGNGQR